MAPQVLKVEELSEEEFGKLSESAAKIDYEEVWALVVGKRLTTAGFEAAVNTVRKAGGQPVRQLYFSEKKRMFDKWTDAGRKIETKIGFFPTKSGKTVKQNVYKFEDAPAEETEEKSE